MHKVRIKKITPMARNVFSYLVEKPDGFDFKPGQATEVAIDKPRHEKEKRPFTFTSLPSWDDLEFTIKSYTDHDGVTKKLLDLDVGDALLIEDPWGTIHYKGKGVFLAGGAGMTPFLSILRDLQAKGDLEGHTLFFANKTEADIIAQSELDGMSGLNVHHVLSDEKKEPYLHGLIDQDFLKEWVNDFEQQFYVCGPDPMVESVSKALKDLGAKPDEITFEE